jgi:hypothetical protein
MKARDCLRHDHPPAPTPGCAQFQYLADLETIGLI